MNRRLIKALLSVLVALAAASWGYSQTRVSMSGDATSVKAWADARFARGKVPPFSFKLDGKSSASMLPYWKWSKEALEAPDPEGFGTRYTWTDPKSGLSVICEVKGVESCDQIEWVLKFRNGSDKQNSGQISDVKAADMAMVFPSQGPLEVHYAEGNKISRKDYAPATMVFKAGDATSFEPLGGRSSEEAFPFYNIESEGSSRGVMMPIGWTGTWHSDFEVRKNGTMEVKAGIKNLDTYLKPGEEIRTASVAFLFWSGVQMDGHNKFRRFLLAHRYPKQCTKPILCSGFNYRDPQPFGEYSAITAEWAVAMIHRYRQFDLNPDIFWMDAGWHKGASDYEHGQSWATTTGNWSIDSKRFPDGMKAVSEAAHEGGAKFLLWFEPERVVKGTDWAVEHPEWMLDCHQPEGSEESTWLLFDLGNDEACDWLCKEYGDLIAENGVDCYRQDCNVKPAPYWAANDEPGRTGMKEIRHIENLYKFWDYLLDRFPGMILDNCASGGKRLDWETISRSIPLWRSDYYHYDDPDGYQCHTYGLNYFLPMHGTGILLPDEYSFRSSLSSTLIFNWKITDGGLNLVEMNQRIEEYRQIQDYYLEDYYPLTGDGDLTGHDVWLAYQMNRPSDCSGIVVAFRREESKTDSITVNLQGLDLDADYSVKVDGSEEETILSGRSLSEGYTITLLNPKSSTLIKYNRI